MGDAGDGCGEPPLTAGVNGTSPYVAVAGKLVAEVIADVCDSPTKPAVAESFVCVPRIGAPAASVTADPGPPGAAGWRRIPRRAGSVDPSLAPVALGSTAEALSAADTVAGQGGNGGRNQQDEAQRLEKAARSRQIAVDAAGISFKRVARRWRQRHAELRLRPRLFGAPGRRSGEAFHRP